MSATNHEKVLKQMTIAAKEAGVMLLTMQQEARKVEQSRQDFVTDADYKSDQLIQASLRRHFPDTPFLTEESGGRKRKKGKLIIVDSIDGTTNYFYGDDGHYWGVSIAYVVDGQTECAVIVRPGTGETFWARRGDRWSLVTPPGSVLRVSKETNLAHSRVWTDWVKGSHRVAFTTLRKLDDNTILPQIRTCCTISAMQVAKGLIDGYVHPRPQPEDIAAAGLIVELAGGRVTDLQGRPWTPFSKSFVATNGLIHDRLLEVLKQ